MDHFAQIAKMKMGALGDENNRDPTLVSYEPPVADTELHLSLSDRSKLTPTNYKEAVLEENLVSDLDCLRNFYEPFFNKASYKPKHERERLELREFDYQVMAILDSSTGEIQEVEDGEKQRVTLPHYGAPVGPATVKYTTRFEYSGCKAEQRVFLGIQGADYYCEIYINGRLVGEHEGFFSTVEYDVSDTLFMGENELCLVLRNDYVLLGQKIDGENGRWFGDKIYAATGPGFDDADEGWQHCPPGMGLLGHIYVEKRSYIFIEDSYIAVKDQSSIALGIELQNTNYRPENVYFSASLIGENNPDILFEDRYIKASTTQVVGLGDTFTEAQLKNAGLEHASLDLPAAKGRSTYSFTLDVPSMRWWNTEEPWLYRLIVDVHKEDGQLLDSFSRVVGRRRFYQGEDKRGQKGMFYLNKKAIKLRGFNTMGFEQQDIMNGDLNQLKEDLLLAKLANCNFLRITQRPVQQELYAMCDRLGILVQTDFPLFGALRRHKMTEALRQIEEMARHIRSYPSCVLVTYINEPFPNAFNQPQLFLTRSELEAFFLAADIVSHSVISDLVIKHCDGDYDPPDKNSLPDYHCYSLWYNGHGLDIGDLLRGSWLPTQKGWLYACGEYGCEGLDSLDLMRRHYPLSWLPSNAAADMGTDRCDWTPGKIKGAQSGDFYHFFYDRPHDIEEWIKCSQEHQAAATRLMTEAFRRNPRMVSFALHHFIDAFPAGWMKAVVDCERRPKPAYFAYRRALNPILLSVQRERWILMGKQEYRCTVFVCNDTHRDGHVRLHLELVTEDYLVDAKDFEFELESVSASPVLNVVVPVPEVSEEKDISLRLFLYDAQGCLLSNQESSIKLLPLPDPFQSAPTNKFEDLIMVRNDVFAVTESDIDEVREGKLLWLELDEGSWEFLDQRIEVHKSPMGGYHFAGVDDSQPHAWANEIRPAERRYWFDPRIGGIAPLARSSMTASFAKPVLLTRNMDEEKNWREESLLCEYALGSGFIVLSTIPWELMKANPGGIKLLSNAVEALERRENKD